MLQNDFIGICADAIQFHEGWADGNPAVANNNPGNLRFADQPGATAGKDFAIFPDFYAGRHALEADLKAKLSAGIDTVRDLITKYAPPNENNTEAYITTVLNYFAWRNIKIKDSDSIAGATVPAVVLIDINGLWKPNDWHAVQQAISQVAEYMPQYCFSTRYTNTDLSAAVVNINVPPFTETMSAISEGATHDILAQLNDGQTMNIMVYDGSIQQGHKSAVGGCEYGGYTLPVPESSFASVIYEGEAFIDSTARIIFHELIHELFALTKQTDTLHAYLIAHGGYAQNLADDLRAVYNGGQLNTVAAVAAVAEQGLQEAQNLSIPDHLKEEFIKDVLEIFQKYRFFKL
jgi:hypothetical protein